MISLEENSKEALETKSKWKYKPHTDLSNSKIKLNWKSQTRMLVKNLRNSSKDFIASYYLQRPKRKFDNANKHFIAMSNCKGISMKFVPRIFILQMHRNRNTYFFFKAPMALSVKFWLWKLLQKFYKNQINDFYRQYSFAGTWKVGCCWEQIPFEMLF